jgi:hypothetical protein
MVWNHGELILTDSRALADVQRVYALLQETHWGVRRPLRVGIVPQQRRRSRTRMALSTQVHKRLRAVR